MLNHYIVDYENTKKIHTGVQDQSGTWSVKRTTHIKWVGRKTQNSSEPNRHMEKQFLNNASTVFDTGAGQNGNNTEPESGKLYKKIGQLQIEVDFLKKALESWNQQRTGVSSQIKQIDY